MGDKLFQSRTSDHPELACPIEESPAYVPTSYSGMGNLRSCLRLFPSYASEALSPSAIANRTNPPAPKDDSITNTVARMHDEFGERFGDRTEWMIGVPGGAGLPGVVGAVINAVGGRRTLLEIAKSIALAISDPKTMPQQAMQLAKLLERLTGDLEQLLTNMAGFRTKLADAIRHRSKDEKRRRSKQDRVADLQAEVTGMEKEAAALSKEIVSATNELVTQIGSLVPQNKIAPQMFRQLVQDIGELRSHLPKQ